MMKSMGATNFRSKTDSILAIICRKQNSTCFVRKSCFKAVIDADEKIICNLVNCGNVFGVIVSFNGSVFASVCMGGGGTLS